MQAVTTANGKLVITMTEQRVHDLNFQSGACLAFWIAEPVLTFYLLKEC